MQSRIYNTIIGTGSYIPTQKVTNKAFLEHEFLERDGNPIKRSNEVIIDKFEAITTIAERRYIQDDLLTSDIAALAAKEAIEDAGIDPETLDYVIVAHNSGDVKNASGNLDMVPSLASKVKYQLGIKNPNAIAYDIAFGCPGWLQALIQADYFLRSGDARRALVIGAEVLSRVVDPHDRDSMIYADGAAAVVLAAKESDQPIGIVTHKTQSDTLEHHDLIFMGGSYDEEKAKEGQQYIKMYGRKVYQYALEKVPLAMKACLDQSGIPIGKVKKILIHQANGKMDEAILRRFYKLYPDADMPSDVMPMTVHYLGNSSVATVPTLLDLILKGKMEGHEINPGEVMIFASVGAGMNINAAIYQF